MTLLAIDTSTAYASVALYDGRTVRAEGTWHAQRRHDDHLFPEIDHLLRLAGIGPADVTRVAVTIGPGSFTGLRVAIAAAQGIARASSAEAVGVPTLDVAAHPFAAPHARVCALIPAGRGEHYAAMYRHRRGAWERTTPIETATVAELARRVARDTLFVGELDEGAMTELRAALGSRASFAPASAMVRRAGHLAEIGWARIEQGQGTRGEALEPLYIREPLIRGH